MESLTDIEKLLNNLELINDASLNSNWTILEKLDEKKEEIKKIINISDFDSDLKKECLECKEYLDVKFKAIGVLVKELVNIILVQQKELTWFREELIQEKKKTEELIQKSEELYLDQLTKVGNRHKYNQIIQELLLNYRTNWASFSLGLIDIDDFKKINDTYGHPVGDKTLKVLAAFLTQKGKDKFSVFRFWWEEFIILSTSENENELKDTLNNILKELNKKRLMLNKNGTKNIRISFSWGTTEIKDPNQKVEDLEEEADKKLYQAKKSGKNKVL